jgi:hypothetical protein
MFGKKKDDRGSKGQENIQRRKEIRPRVLLFVVHKSFRPFLKDCDLCPTKKTWCSAFCCGDSHTTVFVCANCQTNRIVILNENHGQLLSD